MVVDYVKVLLKTTSCWHSISDEDIGIVTPYKNQASKIWEKCEQILPANKLTIGTAAVLQGQEKPIIIISTVSVGQISEFAANFRVFHLF